MSKTPANLLRAQLDALAKPAPKSGVMCWSARELCKPLGYAKWESFLGVVERAIGARKDAGLGTRFYFRELTTTNADGLIVVHDYRLTRLGAHAVAMTGDVRKKAIAFARTYFEETPAPKAPAKKPAAKKATPAKPVAKAKIAAKTKSASKPAAAKSPAKKAAKPAPKTVAKLTTTPAPKTGSRFIPQIGGRFYGSTHASRNSRWNPNCAVSRGYHNAAACTGR